MFKINATIIKGGQEATKNGYPTANIVLSGVEYGIYYTQVHTPDGVKNGITFVLPTIAETHILDFSGDLYGQNITFDFIHRLRRLAENMPKDRSLEGQMRHDMKLLNQFLEK